ncbi:MAG TPA: GAF domain-containing protein, partial [Rhodospirillales bacterium]|nr:GAF domain-containing protein [Rhodospirillales bacterium]
MPTSVPVSRRLLARVRDVMAGSGSAQQRLDNTTAIIAADMVAEVCSIYVMRAGEVLELFSTRGLLASAVHNTRLRVGEGLIGLIAAQARTLALDDAQSHPDFVFRPETGEEVYHSLMGVPVQRGGRVVGVLVVQNRAWRSYSDEEIETLQTVAMVLAELVAGGELISRDELIPTAGNALLPYRLEGIAINPGLGVGHAVLHRPEFNITRLVAENLDQERQALRLAVSEMHGALDEMLSQGGLDEIGEHRDVLDTYRMIADDAGWYSRIEEAIATGLTAEAAVQKVHNDIRARMSQITDPYLRERMHDLEDLGHRLLGHLLGNGDDQTETPQYDNVVLVARNMGPAQLLDYDRSRLVGLVLEEGSATAHVSIVARALDIPVVGQVRNILDNVESGEPIIIDGANGHIFLRPGEEVRQSFLESAHADEVEKAAYGRLRELPTETLDGQRITLNINAGLLIDLPYLADIGADGVGLYRTEVPFMVRDDFPDVQDQRAIYAKVMAMAGGKPVVFRTLDVGGDKVLPYWDAPEEENPAMGWRAIRVSLDRPMLLRQQFRALIQATAGAELQIMVPMIATLEEFTDTRVLLDLELSRQQKRGGAMPLRTRLGIMLEVPSLLFQLPQI